MSSRGLWALALGLAGCDYSGDWLFPSLYEDLDDVYQLYPEDGSEDFVPAIITSASDAAAATVYAEVGASLTTSQGGVTATFVGTGDAVCAWVDPETAYWNTSIAEVPADDIAKKFTYPDNIYDDGDIDIGGGQSLFYTGSPGVEMGGFVVRYEDSLGNPVSISLAECAPAVSSWGEAAAASGKGTPEYCEFATTLPGVSYTVALTTFATPLDDDRLAFAFLLAAGPCQDLRNTLEGGDNFHEECVLRGELLLPLAFGGGGGPFYGKGDLPSWPEVEAFEATFCDDTVNMRPFCEDEANAHDEAGNPCEWNVLSAAENRCFCGDPFMVPDGG